MLNKKYLLKLLFCFAVLTVFAPIGVEAVVITEAVSVIREDCTDQENCFTSLVSWEEAKQEDLISANKIAVARIEGTWSDAVVDTLTIDGWIIDSEHYIKIYTEGDARHKGAWCESAYRMKTTENAIVVLEGDVILDGLQIDMSDSLDEAMGISGYAVQNVKVSNSIIKNSADLLDNKSGINFYNDSKFIYVWNNIVYNFKGENGTGIKINTVGSPGAWVYNNTVYNCTFGFVSGYLDVIAKNNIAQNCVVGFNKSKFNTSSDYNISDIIGDSPNGAFGRGDSEVNFYSFENFHLNENDIDAQGNGVDLSEDVINFSTDIDGDERGGLWDLGADEYTEGVLPVCPVIVEEVVAEEKVVEEVEEEIIEEVVVENEEVVEQVEVVLDNCFPTNQDEITYIENMNVNSLGGLKGNIVNILSCKEADSVSDVDNADELAENIRTIYDSIIVKEDTISDLNKNKIAYFINNGTKTSISLGAGERAGVIGSYFSAFGKLPKTNEDWQDIIKIANGRYPNLKNSVREDEVKEQFKKVYLRDADMNNANDNAAISVMAYGLRPANRNMDSEKNAIKTFEAIYGAGPSTSSDWDTVRAIAYSGAVR